MQSNHQKNLSDEELVALAANGDEEAMAILIFEIIPKVEAKASRFAIPRSSNEDIVQEGLLGFIDAVKKFDPSKGVPFKAFAEFCVHNRMVSAVKFNNNRKNSVLSKAVPFDADSEDAFSLSDPADIISDKFETEYLASFLNSELSDFEKEVINLRLQGKSYEQISLELCRSKKAVDNAIQRVRAKLRKRLNK